MCVDYDIITPIHNFVAFLALSRVKRALFLHLPPDTTFDPFGFSHSH